MKLFAETCLRQKSKSFQKILKTTVAVPLIVLPHVSYAQDFVWNPDNGNGVTGGGGTLDNGITSSVSAPGSTDRVVFPVGGNLRFIEADTANNRVTIAGVVDISALDFDASGYELVGQDDAARIRGFDNGRVTLSFGEGALATITASVEGDAQAEGAGNLIIRGSQDTLDNLFVETGMIVTLNADDAGNAALTNSGDTANEGIWGDVVNDGGTFFNRANTDATIGNLVNRAGLATMFGIVDGNIVNQDVLAMRDGLQVSGEIDNAVGGTAVANDGDIDVGGTINNSSMFTVRETATLTAPLLRNQSTGMAIIEGIFSGDYTGDNGAEARLSGTVNGEMVSIGLITALDGATINGALENAGIVSLAGNDIAGDVLTINGTLSGRGSYEIDLDLSGEGSADRIVIEDGSATGIYDLDFVTTNVPAVASEQRILVFDVDEDAANNFTWDTSGLPPANSIAVYSVSQDDANGDLFVISQINPGVGSVGSNFVLTQSLIGAVISRPTSPYVTGLIYDDPDPCGPGVWTRLQRGNADASSDSGNGVSQVQTTLNADYIGFLAGGDFACFDDTGTGWDLALGLIGGFNDGDISQPVFAIDPTDPTQVTDMVTSVTRTDFLQRYATLYATASSGPWAFDLQYRREMTDFEITNEGVGDLDGIGLEEENIASKADTWSGAASYAYAIPETSFAVVPSIGFASTKGSSGTAGFEDGSDLKVGDFESNVGFAGLTTAWSQVDRTGRGVYSAFVTGTYYNDFSPDTISTFETPQGDAAALSNSSLGSFSEMSAGVNHIRVLAPNGFLGVRQVSANLRGDFRFGEQIDSVGLAGQLRLQF